MPMAHMIIKLHLIGKLGNDKPSVRGLGQVRDEDLAQEV